MIAFALPGTVADELPPSSVARHAARCLLPTAGPGAARLALTQVEPPLSITLSGATWFWSLVDP